MNAHFAVRAHVSHPAVAVNIGLSSPTAKKLQKPYKMWQAGQAVVRNALWESSGNNMPSQGVQLMWVGNKNKPMTKWNEPIAARTEPSACHAIWNPTQVWSYWPHTCHISMGQHNNQLKALSNSTCFVTWTFWWFQQVTLFFGEILAVEKKYDLWTTEMIRILRKLYISNPQKKARPLQRGSSFGFHLFSWLSNIRRRALRTSSRHSGHLIDTYLKFFLA